MFRVRITSPVDVNYHLLTPPIRGLENAQRKAAELQLNNPHWTVEVRIVEA